MVKRCVFSRHAAAAANFASPSAKTAVSRPPRRRRRRSPPATLSKKGTKKFKKRSRYRTAGLVKRLVFPRHAARRRRVLSRTLWVATASRRRVLSRTLWVATASPSRPPLHTARFSNDPSRPRSIRTIPLNMNTVLGNNFAWV